MASDVTEQTASRRSVRRTQAARRDLDDLALAGTLVDLVERRADELADELAFVFLGDGELEQARTTFGRLAVRARAIGAELQDRGFAGERALLLFPSGLEFIEAFLGCLYAGVVAVPVYPPRDSRTTGGLEQLEAIAADAAPATLLTTASLLPAIDAMPAAQRMARIGTDAIPAERAETWKSPGCSADSLAFLQYTSGSTADPKGVMVTHRNVLENQQLVDGLADEPRASLGVSWLPLYHDMGLFGSIVHPLYVGRPSVIMSPLAFLQRPFRWLSAISRWRATSSGAPNFAYELCVARVSEQERDTLDLGSWEIAFTGAEPIRWETLERFSSFFAPAGFRRRVFSPCYGLAEATVGVSFTHRERAPHAHRVSVSELERGRVVPDDTRDGGCVLVGCGPTGPRHRVLVVDPETLRPCAADAVGEIWVSGPSVAAGYWRRPEATERVFGAQLAESHEGPFLRTGDRGFVAGGEVVIVGRSKDLLILRGRNIYPQDIERTVEQSHGALRRGRCAAFGISVAGEERLAVVQEVDPSLLEDEAAALDAIGSAISERHGVRAERIVLVAPGELAKTSSGKIRRRESRRRLQAGELRVEGERVAGLDARSSQLLALAAEVLGLQASALDPARPLTALGIDSLRAVELQTRIAVELGLQVSVADLLGGLTAAEIATSAHTVLRGQDEGRISPARPRDRSADATARGRDFPLSDLQQAYCAGRMPNFELGNVGGHIYLEFESHDLDPHRLERAWRQLIDRHDALRTVVSAEGTQAILDAQPDWSLPVDDLSALSAEDVDAYTSATRARMSHQVFELGRWPMFEVRAHRLADQRLRVYFSIDLLVVDAASLVLLAHEWNALYQDPAAQLPSAAGLRDVIERQISGRRSPAYRRSLDYWREQLRDLPAAPRLPAAKRPGSIERPRFSRRAGSLAPAAWQRFKERAASAGLTPSAALLAVYAEVLAAWSESPRFAVNVTMLTGPNATDSAVVAGPFASFNLIAVDWSAPASFQERAQSLQRRLWQALDHHHIGGVRALRELTRIQSLSRTEAKMPVVFTPVLRELSSFEWLGQLLHGISQTPQVSLDNQAFLFHDGLMFHWDAVDELFPQGVVEEMFAAYCTALEQLSDGDARWGELVSLELGPRRLQEPVGATALASAQNESLRSSPSAGGPSPAAGAPAADGDAVDEHRVAAIITGIVEDVLAQPSLAAEEDLEALGLSSLDMIRIANRLEEEFGFRPEADQLFEITTVADIVRFYHRHAGESHAGESHPGNSHAGAGDSSAGRLRVPGERAAMSTPAPAPRLLDAPEERAAFCARAHGLRRELSATSLAVPLAAAEIAPADYLRRRSHRSFLSLSLSSRALSGLLAPLRDLNSGDGPPRHFYASAGGSYAVQTYVHVRPHRFVDVPEGIYYHHPRDHRLLRVSAATEQLSSARHWWSNRDAFEQSSFSIFFIACLDAIHPLYGERSVHFVTIEAGLMCQLLEIGAPSVGVGLCQIGGFDFEGVRDLFAVEDRHVLVHSMLGGAVEGEAGTQPARSSLEHVSGDRDRRGGAETTGLDEQLARPGAVSTRRLRAKAVLDDDVRVRRCATGADGAAPARVLLTGATGFLGIFLLRELVMRHGCEVTCLVRAPDEIAATRRLERVAARFAMDWGTLAAHVAAVPGDVSQPSLGLPSREHAALLTSVHSIYHCAAPVSWVHPYSALEAGIVQGTRQVLRFAAAGATKPVHYISTLAVFPFDGRVMPETPELDYGGSLLGGYAQCKWVAERIVAQAAARGLPVATYRPPLISGDASTGAFNRSSYFENMVRGCVEMCRVPRLAGVVDVAPVDYVARAIAYLSQQDEAPGQVFHVNNPKALPFDLFTDWMRSRGYRLESLEFEDWKRYLIESPERHSNALYPFVPHLCSASAEHMTIAAHDCRNTTRALAGSGVRCPPVDDALLEVYFAAFEACGFLDRARAAAPLVRA